MLLERRQYDLRPGAAGAFWEAQAKWNRTSLALSVVRRNLSYFQSADPDGERIVHIYWWDSVAHWEETYATLYAEHPSAYFAEVRPMFLKQRNAFFKPAPIAALNPLPIGSARPAAEDIARLGLNPGNLCVLEERVQLLPGALGSYGQRLAEWAEASRELAAHHSLGAFTSFIGSLNQMLQYRWFRNIDAAQTYLEARRSDPAWHILRDAEAPRTRRVSRAFMRPSPLPWLRSVLELRDDRQP